MNLTQVCNVYVCVRYFKLNSPNYMKMIRKDWYLKSKNSITMLLKELNSDKSAASLKLKYL